MKILSVTSLAIPDVKVVRFARFVDERGYFAEPFRRSDFDTHPDLGFLSGQPVSQANESRSRANVVRGLHLQWDPFQGKLVRTLHGHMVDIVLDIRHGSPTAGRIVMYDLPASDDAAWAEWIWVPPGIAHGMFFLQDSRIEYYCTGEYNPKSEASISPMAGDLDWSACDARLRAAFEAVLAAPALLSSKDHQGFSFTEWMAHPESRRFQYR